MGSINLSKGQKIAVGQTNITVGLGWKANAGTGDKFDLDVSTFLLNSNKIIPNENNFVFYGNKKSPNDAVIHSGDCRDGNTSSLDDEFLTVDTTKLSDDIVEIIFVVTIDEAVARRQNFGMVGESYIRLVDNATGEEIAKYELDENFSIETGIEFGRLYLKDGAWKFDASGIGYKEELSFFVSQYYNGLVEK